MDVGVGSRIDGDMALYDFSSGCRIISGTIVGGHGRYLRGFAPKLYYLGTYITIVELICMPSKTSIILGSGHGTYCWCKYGTLPLI